MSQKWIIEELPLLNMYIIIWKDFRKPRKLLSLLVLHPLKEYTSLMAGECKYKNPLGDNYITDIDTDIKHYQRGGEEEYPVTKIYQ